MVCKKHVVMRKKKTKTPGCLRRTCFTCTDNRLSLPYCIYDVRWGQEPDGDSPRGNEVTILENLRSSEPDIISACVVENEECKLNVKDEQSRLSMCTTIDGPSICSREVADSLSSLEGSNISIPSIYWRKKHSILMIRSRIRNDGFDWTSMCSLFGGKVESLDSSDVDSVFDCCVDDRQCVFSRESITSDLSHSINGIPAVPLVRAESLEDLYDLELDGPKSPTKRTTRRPTLCRPESIGEVCSSDEAMESHKVTVSSSSGVVSADDLVIFETGSPTVSVIENPSFGNKRSVSKHNSTNRRISLDETRSEYSPSVTRTKWKPRRLQSSKDEDAGRLNKMSSDLDLFSVLFETTCTSLDSLNTAGFTSAASLRAVNLCFSNEFANYDLKDQDELQTKFQNLSLAPSGSGSNLTAESKRLSLLSSQSDGTASTGSPSVMRTKRKRRRKRTDDMLWDYTDIYMYNDELSESDVEEVDEGFDVNTSSHMLEWEMSTQSGSATGCSQSCGSHST